MLSSLTIIILAMFDSSSRGWFIKLTNEIVEGAIVEVEVVELEAAIVELEFAQVEGFDTIIKYKLQWTKQETVSKCSTR